jgi:hypothetical protein
MRAGSPGSPLENDVSQIRTIEEDEFLDDVRQIALGRAAAGMLDVAFDLDLFNKLKGKSVTLEELGEMAGFPPVSARLMAQFFCREGIFLYRDGKLKNHPAVDKYLTGDSVMLREFMAFRSYRWPLEELFARLKMPPDEPGYQTFTDENFYYGSNPRRITQGEQLTLIYDFSPHRVLLDVASSSGGYCIGIRKHQPHLRCMLFDLPKTEPFAEKVVGEAGMNDAITFHGGSFLTDDLPRGADVALICNILEDWPPETVLLILRKIHDALEPGGKVLVNQYYFEDDWTGPMKAVVHAFYAASNGAQPSYGEMEAQVAAAGFVDVERRPYLVIGRKS